MQFASHISRAQFFSGNFLGLRAALIAPLLLTGASLLASDAIASGDEKFPQSAPSVGRSNAKQNAPPQFISPSTPMKPGNPGMTAPMARPSAMPRDVAPVNPVARPSAKPRDVAPVNPVARPSAKPRDVAPVNPVARPSAKPRDVAPAKPVARPSAKPRDVAPAKPVARPSAKPRDVAPVKPAAPTAGRPSTRPIDQDDAPIGPSTRPNAKPTEKPVAQPWGQPAARPSGRPNEGASANGKPAAKPGVAPGVPSNNKPGATNTIAPVEPRTPKDPGKRPPNKPAVAQPRFPAAVEPTVSRANHFVGDSAYGVPVKTPRQGSNGNANNSSTNGSQTATTINNYNTYNQYVTNVANCNGWSSGSRWSSCGPCDVWQPYNCNDGLAVSFGFGNGGFSFGFFYGSSGAPLCSSWANPWWDGYATSWSCASRWNSCWGSCWNPCTPWWNNCYPYPAYNCVPWYPYSPVVYSGWGGSYYGGQTIVYTQPPVVYVAPPALPTPSALWTFLAEGYDNDAESGFAVLAAADPAESAWLVGEGFARAFRGETAWASDMLRTAFLTDPSGVLRTSNDPRFLARLDALERSLSPLASAAAPSVDALLVIAASQAARGNLSGAFFTATTAQVEGDRTSGTAAFIGWLQSELRRKI